MYFQTNGNGKVYVEFRIICKRKIPEAESLEATLITGSNTSKYSEVVWNYSPKFHSQWVGQTGIHHYGKNGDSFKAMFVSCEKIEDRYKITEELVSDCQVYFTT